MKFEHTFRVQVGIEDAWKVLSDLEKVGRCLPGGAIVSLDDDHLSGSLAARPGLSDATYVGTAGLLERDDAAHRVVIDARGHDAGTDSTASATIAATLSDVDAGTLITLHVDLDLTGEPGLLDGEVVTSADTVLGRFADNLSGAMTAGGSDVARVPSASTGTTPGSDGDGDGDRDGDRDRDSDGDSDRERDGDGATPDTANENPENSTPSKSAPRKVAAKKTAPRKTGPSKTAPAKAETAGTAETAGPEAAGAPPQVPTKAAPRKRAPRPKPADESATGSPAPELVAEDTARGEGTTGGPIEAAALRAVAESPAAYSAPADEPSTDPKTEDEPVTTREVPASPAEPAVSGSAAARPGRPTLPPLESASPALATRLAPALAGVLFVLWIVLRRRRS